MAYPTLVIGPSGTGSGTTISVPNPGVQPGELVIVGMMNNSNTAVSGLPAGWNVGGSNAASSSYDRFTVVWARAESATWPLTATIAATRDFVYIPIRVQNWDSATDPQFLLNNRGASGTTVSFGSMTPTGGASDAIDIIFLGRNNPTLGAATAPTDYTSFIDVTQGTTAAGTALQVASYNSNLNPTGTKTATNADSSLFYNTGHILVKGGTSGGGGTAYPASGEIAAVSASSGSVTSAVSVSGAAVAASSAAGILSAAAGSTAGSVAAVSGASGSTSASVVAFGSSAAISATAGAVTYRTGVSGSSAATSAASGSLSGSLPATTVPKQSEMPAQPFDLYPAPAMSWVVGSAPSGSGYITAAPDSPYIKALGHSRKGDQAGSVAGFVNPAPLQDIAGAGTGTNPLVYPPHGRRILTNSPEVWFRLAQRSYAGFSNVSSRAAVRLRVNGKWVSLMPIYLGTTLGFPSNPENITAGEYAYKLTFPDSQAREIELNTHLEFGGVVIPSGYTLSVPRSAEHVLAILDGSLGGSEKHQTGNFSLNGADGSGAAATYTAVTSYAWAMAQILGYDSVVNSAAGSSGFSISGDTASWKSTNKIPKDVIEHFADLNLIGSANNDQASGQTVAQVDAAAAIVYGNLAATSKPGAINVALGMFTAPAMGSQASAEASVAPYNDVLKARAQQYGLWFINPTTGQTYDPQGNLRKTTSNWVYQDLSDISSDNTHPIQRGANNMGAKVADAILMAHEASVSQAVSGQSASVSATSGSATAATFASGVSAANATASGSITKATGVAGASAAISATSGALSGAGAVSGASAAVSATSGSVAATLVATGRADATSASAGQVSSALPISGATASASTALGAVTNAARVSGVANAVSGTSGSASPTGSSSGTVVAVSAVAGSATQALGVSGQVSAVSATSGVTVAANGVSGTVSAASASAGAINLQARVFGAVAAVASASGILTPSSGASGSASATSGASGVVTAIAQASGSANAVSAAIGAIFILRSVAGVASASSATSGHVANSGLIPMPDILELDGITPVLTLVAIQGRPE